MQLHVITICVSYILPLLHSALYGPGASAPAFQTKASPGDCSDCTSSTALSGPRPTQADKIDKWITKYKQTCSNAELCE